MKYLNFFLLFTFLLSSCVPSKAGAPTLTTVSISPSTLTLTNTPIPTNSPEPTITSTPMPIGGGDLLVAFYAFGDCGSCLIIGNFFTGKTLLEVPVNTSFQNDLFPRGGQIYWSPDGKNVIYTDTNLERMNVFLLNLDTKQPKKLGNFPSKGGTPEYWNFLRDVKWSGDNEFFIFDVGLEDDPLTKSYVSSKDGVVTTYTGIASEWFPDGKTLFSPYAKETYNITSGEIGSSRTDIINKFNFLFISEGLIFVQREKNKISAIPFPKNWQDPTAWQYDSLYSQISTIAELSPEIKNGSVYIAVVQKIDKEHIAILGNIETPDGFSYFFKSINLQSLPAFITTNDILQKAGDTPIMVSPDANYYLMGYCTVSESCQNFYPDWKERVSTGWEFKVLNSDGVPQSFAADLSQFEGVTKMSANIVNRGYGNLTENIAFYWKK